MPVSIPMAIAAVVSAASTIYSGIKAGQAADYNAKVQEQNARYAQDKAAYNEKMHRDNVRKLLSTQRALYGASGVDMTGTPLLVMQDTVGKGELDALAIRHGGDIEAANQRAAATLSRMQGSTARTSGFLKAGTSLLTSKYN
jgi:hypothetical protein